jgi:hypothetical protein
VGVKDVCRVLPHPDPLPKEREQQLFASNCCEPFELKTIVVLQKNWERFSLSRRERAGVRGNGGNDGRLTSLKSRNSIFSE